MTFLLLNNEKGNNQNMIHQCISNDWQLSVSSLNAFCERSCAFYEYFFLLQQQDFMLQVRINIEMLHLVISDAKHS